MSTLYELTGEFLQLAEMAAEEDIDQKVINDTLESLEYEFEEKADCYAKVIKSLDGDAECIDKEITRLTERKNRIKNNITSIKRNLENAMIATDKRKFKTLLFGFNIQKNPPSVSIDDESCIPEKYLLPQEPKVDRTAIKQDLKESGDTAWAHLVQTESLRIR